VPKLTSEISSVLSPSLRLGIFVPVTSFCWIRNDKLKIRAVAPRVALA